MKVLFSPPDITEAEIREVSEAMRSGWITIGPRTKKLECTIADFLGTGKVACLNSATAAMEMTPRRANALIRVVLRVALGDPPADEVERPADHPADAEGPGHETQVPVAGRAADPGGQEGDPLARSDEQTDRGRQELEAATGAIEEPIDKTR